MTGARLSAALLLAVSVAGCEPDVASTGPTFDGQTGRLRVVSATPDAARPHPVNITVDGVPVAVNVAYGAGTAYVPASAGSHRVVVRRTADTTVVLHQGDVTVGANSDHTLVTTGTGAGTQGTLLSDDNAAPASGNIRLRVVNASPTATSVDVYLTTAAADITTATPAIAALAFRAASSYQSLAAGTYRLRATTAGTKTVVLDVTLPAIAAGGGRTILVLDRAQGGTPLTSAVLTDR